MYKTYDLKVGYGCDNNCIHCVIQDSKRDLIEKNLPTDLTTDECMELLAAAVEEGVHSVTITGGEPSIRSDIYQLMEFCASRGIAITMQTNGSQLSSTEFTSRVKDIEKITFVVALHGVTSDVHDAITRAPGSFDLSLKAIRAMRVLNKNVIIKTVISSINMPVLPDFIPFLAAEGISDINMAFPHAQGAARENFELVVPRYHELKPYLEQCSKLAKDLDIHLTYETVPMCILPNYPEMTSELIYKFKEVRCTQVREETFDWNDIRLAIKTKNPSCEQCFFNDYCEGPWSEYVQEYGFDEFSPVSVE